MATTNNDKMLRVRDIPAWVLEHTGVTRFRHAVYHWIRVGRGTYDGRKIKLPVVEKMGVILVRESDLIQFLKEVN